jgi:hypothetical protein
VAVNQCLSEYDVFVKSASPKLAAETTPFASRYFLHSLNTGDRHFLHSG